MFKKNKKEENKSKRSIDKIIMGAVIGGAIGSVLGATIAPKKGKETRKEIKPRACKKKSEIKLPLKPKILVISLLLEKTKFGSSGE